LDKPGRSIEERVVAIPVQEELNPQLSGEWKSPQVGITVGSLQLSYGKPRNKMRKRHLKNAMK
jgi:hypothetical protein